MEQQYISKCDNPLLENSSVTLCPPVIPTTLVSSHLDGDGNIASNNGALPDILSSHTQVFTNQITSDKPLN